tara:strand:- start:7318 stop:8163 length:846 start_codon:yes stop_codon:yes gene_type:complete
MDSDNDPAGSNTHLQYNNNGNFGGISTFTFDGTDMKVADDTKIKFGTNSDSHIEYNENGDDFLVISGSANGIVLSGSTIQIAGTLEGASPLKIGGEMVFTSTGSAGAFAIGPNSEAKIYYENDDDDHLIVSGSAGGTRLLGTNISIPSGNLGVRINGDANITHGITLPDTSAPAGQVKANAFVSYSSIRFKENIEPLGSALDTISKLEGVSYNWKDTGKKDFGFIAEEVGKVLPEIVEWNVDSQYANTMDYTRIISFLVEAVKEQQKKIDIMSEKLDKIDV